MPSNADRKDYWRKRRLNQKKHRETKNAKRRRKKHEIGHEENLIEISAEEDSSGDEEEAKEEVGVTSLPEYQVGDTALLKANTKERGCNLFYISSFCIHSQMCATLLVRLSYLDVDVSTK